MPSGNPLRPYRIEIQQGNYLSAEAVAQLKVGMTRDQVRFVLGTPLVTDVFHGNRWDYVYYREPRDGPKERMSVTVFFEEDRLARIVSDIPAKPAAAEPAGKADAKN